MRNVCLQKTPDSQLLTVEWKRTRENSNLSYIYKWRPVKLTWKWQNLKPAQSLAYTKYKVSIDAMDHTEAYIYQFWLQQLQIPPPSPY